MLHPDESVPGATLSSQYYTPIARYFYNKMAARGFLFPLILFRLPSYSCSGRAQTKSTKGKKTRKEEEGGGEGEREEVQEKGGNKRLQRRFSERGRKRGERWGERIKASSLFLVVGDDYLDAIFMASFRYAARANDGSRENYRWHKSVVLA